MVPIMQNSFASKKHDFKGAERDPNTNTNTNTNSADSSSSSNATAENTNNIDNTATASSNNACAIALTCSHGSTTVTPPPADPCPHSPYTDLVGGLCENGAPTFTCTSLAGAITPPSGPFGDNTCAQFGPLPPDNVAFINACVKAGGTPREISCDNYPATPGAQ